MRPTSRSEVRLKPADPRQVLEILFNYMMTEGDRVKMRPVVGFAWKIIELSALNKFRGNELSPGP